MNSQALKKSDTSQPPSCGHSPQFQPELIALIPHMQAYSRMLCRRRVIAEDMVQEALMKAWCARDRFEPGTNLKGWLFTILRNEIFSHGRRAWREAVWDSEKGESNTAPPNEQEWTMELFDTSRALRRLPQRQREALILIAVGGFSYEDGAKLCGTPVGTVKSRVARARIALHKTLDGDKPLPRYSAARARGASEDILAQLSALAQPGAHVASAYSE